MEYKLKTVIMMNLKRKKVKLELPRILVILLERVIHGEVDLETIDEKGLLVFRTSLNQIASS